jgi:hypothetical protein
VTTWLSFCKTMPFMNETQRRARDKSSHTSSQHDELGHTMAWPETMRTSRSRLGMLTRLLLAISQWSWQFSRAPTRLLSISQWSWQFSRTPTRNQLQASTDCNVFLWSLDGALVCIPCSRPFLFRYAISPPLSQPSGSSRTETEETVAPL